MLLTVLIQLCRLSAFVKIPTECSHSCWADSNTENPRSSYCPFSSRTKDEPESAKHPRGDRGRTKVRPQPKYTKCGSSWFWIPVNRRHCLSLLLSNCVYQYRNTGEVSPALSRPSPVVTATRLSMLPSKLLGIETIVCLLADNGSAKRINAPSNVLSLAL